MIVLQKSVPEVYYNQSRDFQSLARAFEVLFNYAKTNVDVLRGLPFSDNLDTKLLNLLAYTLGFATKHNYNEKDLYNVCSTFAKLLKKKGSIDAIDLAIRALLNAQQISEFYDKSSIARDLDDKYHLIITLPYGVQDLVLLEDLFDYILPAGFTYSFKFAIRSEDLLGANLGMNLDNKQVEYRDYKIGGIFKPVVDNEDVSIEDERFNYENPQEVLHQVNTNVVVKPDDVQPIVEEESQGDNNE